MRRFARNVVQFSRSIARGHDRRHGAHPQSGRDTASAFTLIELLTVVAIIAILSVLLVSAVRRGVDRARSVHCVGNLRQIGIAMNQHVFLTGGIFPGTELQSGNDQWLRQYDGVATGERRHFVCSANRGAVDAVTGEVLKPSYGLNIWGSGLGAGTYGLANEAGIARSGIWVDLTQIEMPSYMIAFGDSGDAIWPTICPTLEFMRPARRHLDGANMLFCDGHVEYAKFRDWVAHEDEVMARWNRDHRPHPETWFADLTQE